MAKTLLKRRTFLKGAAALTAMVGLSAGTATSLLAEEPAKTTGGSEDVKVIRTACRGCGKVECGVLVTVQNGRAVKIEGDPSAFQTMGNCCTKSQASIQAAYHPARLYHPMKRTNPKDNDDPGWVRISWDEATTTIAEKMQEVMDKYGPETIITYNGTSRIWSMQGEGAYANLYSTPNAFAAWQVCKGPRHFMTCVQSEMAWSWMATVDRPRVYVQWGGASEISNYDDSCRTTVDAATKAETHIIVDPRLTGTGKEADYWLGLRPGTDGAMALAWTNVVVENKLIDEGYVKKWTNAPFLVVKDMPASECTIGSWGLPKLQTRLLKESDLIEDGKSTRFMIWDSLGNRMTYFDADPMVKRFEGEDWKPQTKGHVPDENFLEGVAPGWVADLSGFGVEDGFATPIEPALFGRFEVTLKDGSKHTAVPVWDLYVQRLADYTPEKVAEITGVSAQMIRDAALAYATRVRPESGYGNGGIQYMLATEHYGQAGENVRCIDLLTGITGNYDTPGGMRGATRAPMEMGCADQSPALGPGSPLVKIDMSKKLGGAERPMYKWWSLWGDAVYINKAMRDGNPFPIKAGMNSSGDFMNMCNAKLNYDALLTLDFFWSTELWFSPITGAADIVLPVHHWLEVNAGRRSQGSSGAMGANIRCIEPAADTIWDPVICQIIYMKMGTPWDLNPDKPWPQMDFNDPFSPEAQKAAEYAVLDAMVQVSGHKTWDEFAAEFAEKGWWDIKAIMPKEWGVYRRYEVGQAARFIAFSPSTIEPPPPSPGFSTPTTKHEIWSTIMETCWPDQDREMTKYFEPLESPVATPELFEKYPFICMTGRRIPVYFHNEHRQLPWCRELWPAPRVEINPADAAELGIEQGDWVWIENDRGKIRQTADLYYGVGRGMINCEHQWWFPELNQADRGFSLSGCNCLVDPMAADQDTGASMVRGYAVKIYKATAENSPFNNPVPCGNDGTPIIHDASDPRLKAWLPDYVAREEA